MKNKIKQFAKGNFLAEQPDICLAQTHLELDVGEGEIYEGSFEIRNRLDGDIRGLVYPSSFRVHLKESGFEGNPVTVRFTYDAEGLEPGFVEKGSFTLVTNGGEYVVTFTAIVEKPYIMTSFGKVQSLKDFRGLACKDFLEAHRLFRSREFYEVLKYEEKRIYALYDNMRKWSLSEAAMEEFLVGTKQKERIYLTLSEGEKTYKNLLEPVKDELTVEKNTWGFQEIQVRASGDFIRILQSRVTTDDFLGNTFHLSYVLESGQLHAGRNFGQIILETPYETLTFAVNVHQESSKARNEREDEFLLAQIVKGYLGMKAGKTTLNDWVGSAAAKMQTLKEKESGQDLYKLILADIYLAGGKTEEAAWILENYTYKKAELGKTPLTGLYYLFLLSHLPGHEDQRGKVLTEMKRVHLKQPKKWQIALMMMKLDPLYQTEPQRLRLLERQFYNGANGIRFYLEAYNCFQVRTDLLKKPGAFELQVLNFAVHYGLLSKTVALHLAELACMEKSYSKKLCQVLVRIYKVYPQQEILSAICMQLIKGHVTVPASHRWYEKALEAELKIAQLYEYYMLSLEEKHVRGKLPRTIYLYFRHGSTLNDRKTALLYANIITYEDEMSELYEGYREQIEAFAWEQLEKRRISENLRIIYRRFCREDGMNPVRVKAMYDICHTYQVTTKMPGMKYILVVEPDGTVSQRTACDTAEGAQVFLYDKSARIVWEAKNGWHYADSFVYDTVRMFYEPKFLELCRHYAQTTESKEPALPEVELDFANIKKHGVAFFGEENVFRMCSKKIREENYQEDDFLTELCFVLFLCGQYDKVVLTYLADFYCGPTLYMKKLWKTARGYEVQTKKLAERIITQMLFTGMLYEEEPIFQDYYEGKPYFRIKQAYLAYVSREYVLRGRRVQPCVFEMIQNEYTNKESFADICKVAMLKYYAGKDITGNEEMLHTFLWEMTSQQMIFPFYLAYKKEWLRELQLYDKVIVKYTAEPGSKVKLFSQIESGDIENLSYESEILIPVCENVYVKAFTLYENETLRYYVREELQNGNLRISDKNTCRKETDFHAGKYGRLNEMTGLPADRLKEAMRACEKEERMAGKMYHVYE